MSDVQEYTLKTFVRAEKLENAGPVFVSNGKAHAKPGDYLVYANGGASLVKGSDFEAMYVLVEASVSEARKFSPTGKTAEEVIAFLRENPEEVSRVMAEEAENGKRKTILNYA